MIAAAPLSPARAAPNDLTARISPAGLNFIGAEVPKLVPKSFTIPALSHSFSSCSKLTVPSTSLSFTIKQVKITPQTGKLKVFGEVTNLTGSAQVKLSAVPGLCVWSLGCGGDFKISKGTVTATFKPVVSGGTIALQSPVINAVILESAVSVNLNKCGGGIGTAISWILDHAPASIRQWLVDKGEQKLESWILTETVPEIEKLLAGYTSYSGALQGITVDASLAGATSASSGLSANASLGVGITTPSPGGCPQDPKPAPLSTSGAPGFGSHGEHLAVGISRAMLSEAILGAWDSGLLCLPMSRLKTLGLSTSMLGVAGIIVGLSSLDSIDVNAPEAPEVKLVTGSGGRVDLIAEGFTIVMKGQGPSGPTTITIKLRAVLHAVISLDPVNRAVTIESLSADFQNLNINASPNQGLNPDPAVVKSLLETVVMPLVVKEVVGTDLVPHVVHKDGGPLDPYYLYLVSAYTDSKFIKLYARLHKKPSFDSIDPTTKLVTVPAPLVKPQLFNFVASGTDNATPEPLLRFSWRIDGGGWSFSSYSRGWTRELKDGSHEVEVRARDLHGNYDSSPASFSFEVDGQQPTINVTSAPTGTIQSGPAQVDFTVSDDRTAPGEIEVKVKIERQPAGGGATVTVRDDPYTKGVSTVPIGNLQPGTYDVQLGARDEAGNASSVAVAFSFQSPAPQTDMGTPPPPPGADGGVVLFDDGGNAINPVTPTVDGGGCACQVHASSSASAMPLLLLSITLALAWRRRRRP